MKTLEERLAQVEVRLGQIERLLPDIPAVPRAETATPTIATPTDSHEPKWVSRPQADALTSERKPRSDSLAIGQ